MPTPAMDCTERHKDGGRDEKDLEQYHMKFCDLMVRREEDAQERLL